MSCQRVCRLAGGHTPPGQGAAGLCRENKTDMSGQ